METSAQELSSKPMQLDDNLDSLFSVWELIFSISFKEIFSLLFQV